MFNRRRPWDGDEGLGWSGSSIGTHAFPGDAQERFAIRQRLAYGPISRRFADGQRRGGPSVARGHPNLP